MNITHYASVDAIILTITFILFFVASLRYGKSTLICFILAFYPAYTIYENFHYLSSPETLVRVGLFLVFFIPIYLACRKFVAAAYSFSPHYKYFQAIVLSAAATSQILFFNYFVVSLDTIHNFSKDIDTLYKSKVPFIVWLAVPIVAILITNKD